MKLKFIIFLLIPASFIYGAAFTLPSHLVNVPRVTSYLPGDIEVGMASGFFNGDVYEFDAMFRYAVTTRAQVAVNWVNKDTFVGHFHYNFLSSSTSKYGLAGGFANISSKSSISSWDDYAVTQNNTWSPYVVGQYKTPIADFYAGFGGNQFVSASEDDEVIQLLKGLMFGVDMPFYDGRLSVEYDGKDFNVGARLPVAKYTDVHLGLTELGNSSAINRKYSDESPVRYFSFAMVHRFNLFKSQIPDQEKLEDVVLKAEEVSDSLDEFKDAFSKEIDILRKERHDLAEELKALRAYLKDDLKYIDEKDKEKKYYMRHHYLNTTQDASEKILSYYYKALEHVARSEHYDAIAVLQKAIVLNPYLPQLYTRLGSIYYDLDLKSMAVMQWEKALELEPENLELQRFIQKNSKYKTK